jgi:GT2 family glycosyltransferase
MDETSPQELQAGPKVTAILISYNQAPALRRAIEALDRSKNRELLEILVVDGGSRDGSQQIDSEYSSITVLRLPHHLGAGRAMNIGTRTAKTEFVFYLDPSIEVAPDTVPKLSERLEADADAVAVCPLLVDPEGKPVSKLSRIPAAGEFAALCAGRQVPAPDVDLSQESVSIEFPGRDAILVRKQFIAGMNYFDARYGHSWVDAELAMQIRRAGKKIRLYPAIRATIHPSPDPVESDPLFVADRVLGAAAFLGKYDGFLAGLQFRIGAILRALAGLRLGEVMALVSGQKLDGTQSS